MRSVIDIIPKTNFPINIGGNFSLTLQNQIQINKYDALTLLGLRFLTFIKNKHNIPPNLWYYNFSR